MQRESLYIYVSVNGIEQKFPAGENPAIINEWTYNAQRMGGTPTITGTVMHSLCLDDFWTKAEYVKLNGEKFYINQVPTSAKDTDDERYKHEISLVSERIKLENIYFFDVVTDNTESQYQDRYRSNNTEFSFYGDLTEFVARLNDSLVYSGLYSDGFKVVIDDGINAEAKEISLNNAYMAEALQEIYKTYDIPYYWVGKTCHVGYTENAIPTVFEYGQGKGLISISKTNANFRIINRIAGTGSSDNIPHYYPNKAEDRNDPANGGVWITPTGKLMPPIYVESKGAERFYNAQNNMYDNPNGGKYVFSNPYTTNNPMEGIQQFDDIKPSIKGMKNAAGQLLGQIADIAFDSDDSDDVDENGDYIHSYFYVKLHIFNGIYGFNLFKQALANGGMTFNMTSGNCAPCAFEVGVSEPKLVGDHYEFENPVQVYDNGNIVNGNYSDKVNVNNIQPRQQDTSKNEVWVALKKEIDTFGVVMPNATNNYKPSIGDTFVITNILLPQVYITKAQNDLKDAIIQYMSENNDEKFTFSITFSRIYLQRNSDIVSMLNENARIIVRYNGHDYTLYVTNYTCKSDGNILTEVTVELDEKLSVSQSSLKAQMESIAQKHAAGNADSIDILARGQRHFLRKDVRDIAQKQIDFKEGLTVGNFTNMSGGAMIIDEDGHSYGEVDKLKVRMKAYFESLEVQKVNTTGGKVVISPAGAVTLAFVDEHRVETVENEDGESEEVDNGIPEGVYRCYFLGEQDGVTVENLWKEKDQAMSRTFNVTDGIHQGVSNHYYWRLVAAVSSKSTMLEKNGLKYHWIDLLKAEADTDSGIPVAADVVAQVGNREDKTRQSALIFSAVDTYSPSITLYNGIDHYTFLNKEYVEYGVNKDKAFFRVFGDFYVGDRIDGNEKEFVKYENGKVDIAGTVHIGGGSTIGGDTFEEYIKKVSPPVEQEDIEQFVNNIVNPKLEGIQNQIDGVIEAFNGFGAPTLTNFPAENWITDEQRKAHNQDTYTDKTEYVDNVTTPTAGQSWKWQYTSPTDYGWVKIADSDATRALLNAARAQDTADGKRRVFTTQPTTQQVYDTGDMWVNATYGTQYNNDILRCITHKNAGEAFNIAHWTLASKYTDDTKAQEALDEITNTRNSLDALETNVNQFKTDYDNFASDGVFTSAEVVALKEDIKYIESIFQGAKGSYDMVIANSLLLNEGQDSTAKTDLSTALDQLQAAKDELIEAVEESVADRKINDKEIANVNSKYSNFNNKYNAFYQALNIAERYITDKTINNKVEGLDGLLANLAIANPTDIYGGLILTSMVALRNASDPSNPINAGINGVQNAATDIATWWGGGMQDKQQFDNTFTGDGATSLIRFDGSGYFANGAIWWNKTGQLHADPLSFFVGDNYVGLNLALFQFVPNNVTKIEDVNFVIPQAPFKQLNVVDNIAIGKIKISWDAANNALKVESTEDGKTANLYATGGVSALGIGGVSGGTGGAGALYELVDVLPNSSGNGVQGAAAGSLLSYDGTHWKAVAQSSIVPDLTGYATESWVTGQGFATVSAMNAALGGKVDKVSGKGLSTNDFTTALLNKLNGIEAGANKYVLPVATSSVLGGMKLGYTSSGKNYKVQADASGNAFVNVPWTDTVYTLTKAKVEAVLTGDITSHTHSQYLTAHQAIYALTLQRGGVNVGTYTPNSAAKTINIALPTFAEILSKPTTLAGYGITDGVNSVTVTGSGNAVTAASVSGHKLTLTKGTTFLPKATFDDLFEKVNLGTAESPKYAIKAKYDFYSEGGVSALGISSVSGEGGTGGGLIETVLGYSDLSSSVPTDNVTVFNADTVKKIYDKLVQVEGGALTSVSWGIIQDKPTTVAGYGITDAYTKTQTDSAITSKINSLDVASAGGSGKYIQAISQTDGKISATVATMPTALKNPTAITIQKNGTSLGSYDGSAAKTINISDVASAATLSSHTGNTTVHITAAERTKWNKVVTDFAAITGEDTDTIINKWEEVVAFLDTYTEADTLAGLLGNKADKTVKVSAGTGLSGGGDLSANRTLSLAASGVTAGTYTKVTVDTYGRVTAGANPTTLAGYGITDAYTQTQANDTFLAKTGGTMKGAAVISFSDSGNWNNNNADVTFPVRRGGLKWSGQSDSIELFAEETAKDNLDLVIKFNDDNSNGLSLRDKDGSQKTLLSATGNITMSGKLTSSQTTSTYLAGNKGDALINSTAAAGAFTMLAKLNSTGGYFTHGVYQTRYMLLFTLKSTVDAGTNSATYNTVLMDESGRMGIGTISPSYKLHVSGTLYASGAATLANTLTVSGLLTANGGIAIPASKTLKLGNGTISWDDTYDCFHFSHGLYSDDFVSALGLSNTGGGGAGGGVVESIYRWADLGGTFSDSANDTFNAYTINKIRADLMSVDSSLSSRVTSLEGGAAVTVTTTGSGNAITAISKSGTAITATKGATFLPYTPANGGLIPAGTTSTWGNSTGENVAGWADSTGACSFRFKKDNPSAGKMSMLIDGTVYINEGSEAVASQTWVNGRGFLTAHQSLSNYVTLSTDQTITGKKTFKSLPVIDLSASGIADKAQSTVLRVKYKSNELTFIGDIISVLGSSQTAANNFDVRIGSDTGSTWISAGESGKVLQNHVDIGNTENIWLTADSQIRFFTGCSNDGATYTNSANITTAGITAKAFIKSGGTASQILMADGTVTTKKTLDAVNNAGWTTNANDQFIVPTMSFISYWNGRYNATVSNLQYCDRGRFGDVVTHSHSEYVTALGTNGNNLTWTRNGVANNITVPYASKSEKLVETLYTGDLNSASTTTYLGKLLYAGGDNTASNKPAGVDAYGALVMRTAGGHTGQILISSNKSTGLYWRTGASVSLGAWRTVLDSVNYSTILDNRYYTESEINTKLTNGSVTKVGTATVGSASLPVYFNAGTVTACTASSLFSALSSSAATNLSVTVGGQNRTIANLYARYLANSFTSRQASMNLHYGDGTLRHYVATSSTTTGKPENDAHILHLSWDNTGGWDGQIAVPTNHSNIQWRNMGGKDASGNYVYNSWKTLANLTDNVASATKLQTARTINGTSFNGTANITTANWGTARNIGIVNSDGTGTAVTVSVNGSGNVNLKLPATIKAALNGNADTATALTSSAGSATRPVYFSGGKPVAGTYTFGNASGNAPVSNGAVNTNLNADLLDGWHGVGASGNVIRKSGYLTSATASLSSYWGKVASLSWSNENNDRDVTLYMHSAYNSVRGIVHIRARWNSATSVNVSMVILSGNLNKDYLRLYYDASAVTGTLELWYNCGARYGVINTYVLSETDRTGTEKNIITLYGMNFATVQTLPSRSYITATYLSLLNNSYSATQLQNTRSIWGQNFNGTGNVSGNMTGVGSISASGEVKTTSPNAFRMINGNYGAFWRNDADSLYLLLTDSGSPEGSYNTFRPFAVKLATGSVTFGTEVVVKKTVGFNNGLNKIEWDATNSAFKFNGNLYATDSVSALGISSTSDIRLKDVLRNVTLDIKAIADAPSFIHTWKGKSGLGEFAGTSAQYWQNVLPQVVVGGRWLSLDYGKTALLSAIALARRSENHEQRIRALEAENRKLRNELESIIISKTA